MKNKAFIIAFFTVLYVTFFAPTHALATQTHGAPEGVYVHQLAHIFFMLSMGFLIHWLRERKLVKEDGWRFIQYAAIFLILWNMDTFVVHLLEGQLGIIHIKKISIDQIQINAVKNRKGLEILYYIAKLDHLLCVPALYFLYLGLRRLVKEEHANTALPEIQRNSQL